MRGKDPAWVRGRDLCAARGQDPHARHRPVYESRRLLCHDLHEPVHWTGHPDRLAREFGQRFGDAAYAFEELVAELGSAFVLGHCGLVDATIEGHAAYLDSWLRVLRNDRNAIFTAARLAGAAFEFIVAKGLTEEGDSPPLPDEE